MTNIQTFADYQHTLSRLPQRYRDDAELIHNMAFHRDDVTEPSVLIGRLIYCLGKLSVEAGEALEVLLHFLRDGTWESTTLFDTPHDPANVPTSQFVPLDVERRIIEELGDALRYLTEACTTLRTDLDRVATENVQKVARKAEQH